MVDHPNQSQPNQGFGGDTPPCRGVKGLSWWLNSPEREYCTIQNSRTVQQVTYELIIRYNPLYTAAIPPLTSLLVLTSVILGDNSIGLHFCPKTCLRCQIEKLLLKLARVLAQKLALYFLSYWIDLPEALDLRHRHRLRHPERLVEAEVAQAAPSAAVAAAAWAGRAAAVLVVGGVVSVLGGGGVEDVGVEGVSASDASRTVSSFRGHIEQCVILCPCDKLVLVTGYFLRKKRERERERDK